MSELSAIGIFLKNKRVQAGYTQEELAKACGIKYKSTICKIESGTQKISMEEINNISKVLNNFHFLEALQVAGYITDADINPELRLHHLHSLNEDDIKNVQTFINFLIYSKNKEEGKHNADF